MYSLQVSEDRVVLRTTSFRAERASVLHSGIYSRELAASLLSGAVVVLFLFLVALWHRPTVGHFIIAALAFAVLVPVTRYYIFREPELITVFDPGADVVRITLRAPLKRHSVVKTMSRLKGMKVVHHRFEVENPDGVEFVKKIALQHGQVMPDFGKPQQLYSLVLEFEDGTYEILTRKDRAEIEQVLVKLRYFLNTEDDKEASQD